MSCNCAECSLPDVTCSHRFEDASGNRVYLNCQRCGLRDPLEPPADAADRTAELEAALSDLVAYVDTAGGYMTHEHQAVLWRARAVLG